MMSYTHFKLWEREVIKKMLKDQKSIREIAVFLGRSPSSVSREIQRNSDIFWYHPFQAQQKYLYRRQNSKTCKLDIDIGLQNHVINSIKDKQSPDAIAGRLKLINKRKPDKWISHETIYQWVYKKAHHGDELYKYLARSARKRQRRQNSYKKRILIPNRRSIHQRPKSVSTRNIKGHWEADIIVGKGRQGYIATLVERKSYFLAAGYMANKKPSTCNRAILEAAGNILNRFFKTITFDNGTEFFEHSDIEEALECKNYFADPYSSWQRAINEHTNGMLRRYFPKSMDFKNLTQNDVDEAVRKLNNTPRKSLGYRTPYEVFYNLPVALLT